MNIKIDVSEDLESYKNELDTTLCKLERELNSMSQSNKNYEKGVFNELDININICDNNVRFKYVLYIF